MIGGFMNSKKRADIRKKIKQDAGNPDNFYFTVRDNYVRVYLKTGNSNLQRVSRNFENVFTIKEKKNKYGHKRDYYKFKNKEWLINNVKMWLSTIELPEKLRTELWIYKNNQKHKQVESVKEAYQWLKEKVALADDNDKHCCECSCFEELKKAVSPNSHSSYRQPGKLHPVRWSVKRYEVYENEGQILHKDVKKDE